MTVRGLSVHDKVVEGRKTEESVKMHRHIWLNQSDNVDKI